MSELSSIEKELLDAVQLSLPFVERPFDQIGSKLGIRGEDVISILNEKRSVVRNISAIFNGERLGYHLSLVTFSVPAERVEEVAGFLTASPCVSHNYLREHGRYNLWFTVALPPEYNLDEVVARMAERVSVEDYLILRNEKMLKIGVHFSFGDTKVDNSAKSYSDDVYPLTEREREIAYLLQKNLPLCDEPFKAIIGERDISLDEFLSTAKKLKGAGVIRRYSAVVRHREAGYSSNAMTAWKAEDFAPFMEEKSISHLYLRTVYPGRWEYPLFAMIHSRSEEELQSIISSLSERSGVKDYLVLKSLKEFKKERVVYFSPEMEDWIERI